MGHTMVVINFVTRSPLLLTGFNLHTVTQCHASCEREPPYLLNNKQLQPMATMQCHRVNMNKRVLFLFTHFYTKLEQ